MQHDPTRVRDIADELKTLPEPSIAGRLLVEARKSGAFTGGPFVGAGVLLDELAAATPADFGRLWDGVLTWFIYSGHGDRLPIPELPAPPDKPPGTRRFGPPEHGAFHRLIAGLLPESVATEPEAATADAAPKRLIEVKGDSDGAAAIVKGKRYSLTGEQDAAFLSALIERNGTPISATALSAKLGERPDRIMKRLPAPVRNLVLRPARKGGREGYRLKV